MKKIIATLAAVCTMAVSLGSMCFSANAWYDQNGTYHYDMRTTGLIYYNSNSFKNGIGWKTKEIGYIKRTGNNINMNAAYVVAHYNCNVTGDHAYTTANPLLYNTTVDCLVNYSGSTKYSSSGSAYSGERNSGTMKNIKRGYNVGFKGTIYW